MATTTLWLAKKKAPDLFEALTILLNGSADYSLAEPPAIHSPVEKSDVISLIPWFSLRDGAFATDLCALWKEGYRWFVLVTPSPEHPLPWAKFPAHLRTAFDVAIRVCNTPSLEQLRESIGATIAAIDLAKADESWANRRVQEYVEAKTLYTDRLSIYSHNSKTDVTNEFLAPARLLMLDDRGARSKSQDEWKKVWEKPKVEGAESKTGFKIEVLDKLPGDYGSLGKELAVAAEKITEGLKDSDPISVTDLENLMALLTGIRVSAGVHTHAGGSSPVTTEKVDPICSNDRDDPFQVLVVDDHAASWSPVFERLREKLLNREQASLNVSFEFSLDGETVKQSKAMKDDRVHFSYYDLVILDVFLGGTTGIEILKLLRRDFSLLPVLLWTTSRDEEITAEATLANGILLKKTVTWESLTNAVARWVEKGKAIRTTTLPNPFFNHTITNLPHRQLAVDFHEWCLKQLDSFHALDGEYFRFFTDHGGRHIVKLWELLEQALQPFLQDKSGLLLPENDDSQRELEILGLYLTVICHELGMFPMHINGRVENFAGKDKEFPDVDKNAYPDDVRTLHAPRGMLMLFSGTRSGAQYWNDHRGAELGGKLAIKTVSSPASLGDRVAVLTGYHARCFKSLNAGHFLNWDNTKDGFGKKVSKLNLPRQWPDILKAIEQAFTSLDASFKEEESRKRLRLQCAVFRFVDALDITYTRNPAEFLAELGNLPAKQFGENLKRELCGSATIKNGDVFVTMLARFPQAELVGEIIHFVNTSECGKDVDCQGALKFCEDLSIAGKRIKEPWDVHLQTDLPLSVLCLQKPLDCWLKQVWRLLMGDDTSPSGSGAPLANGGPDTEFVNHLKKINVLDSVSEQPKLTLNGARIVASITALSVAGEILDEYEAIFEAGLTDKLRLGKFEWDEKHDWNKPLPNGLTTLKRAITIASTVAA